MTEDVKMARENKASDPPHRKPEVRPRDAMLAGAFSGVISRACVAPLDVIKIRLQLQVEPLQVEAQIARHAMAPFVGAKQLVIPTGYYKGWIHAMSTVIREEGASALFKGNLTADLLYLGFGAVQFGVYNEWRNRFSPMSNSMAFIGGGVAGSVATTCTYPLDLLRTRLAAQGEPKVYKSLSHAIGQMYRSEGVVGFYRGLIPTLLQIFPYMSLQFCFYEYANRGAKHLKLYRLGRNDSDISDVRLGPIEHLAAGSLSGAGSKLIVLPMDTVRKRLQVQGFESARKNFGKIVKYKNMTHCMGVIYANEGLVGFYKGGVPATLKALIASSVTWMAFEQLSKFLSERRTEPRAL